MQTKLKLKAGDIVRVTVGSEEIKGKEGKILSINRETMRAIVEGVNMITKHQKPNAANPQGGLEKREGTIHISNLVLIHKGNPTKVGRKVVDGKVVRYAKKTKNQEVIK